MLQNIRKALKAAFPGTEFGVSTAGRFYGLPCYEVRWLLGPSNNEVAAALAEIRDGYMVFFRRYESNPIA